jgi:hypothetical protein
VNLIIKKIIDLPWAKEIIDSVKDIVKFFKKHHIEGSCLNRIQIEKIGKGIQLQLPGNTRWGSHYSCLNSVIASKKALQVIIIYITYL